MSWQDIADALRRHLDMRAVMWRAQTPIAVLWQLLDVAQDVWELGQLAPLCDYGDDPPDPCDCPACCEYMAIIVRYQNTPPSRILFATVRPQERE